MDNVAPMSIRARSAPRLVHDAPSEIFISVNDEAVHGIGRTIHEAPPVPNTPGDDRRFLHAGLVITIEPILGAGGPGIVAGDDGWTISTADGAPVAHVETRSSSPTARR